MTSLLRTAAAVIAAALSGVALGYSLAGTKGNRRGQVANKGAVEPPPRQRSCYLLLHNVAKQRNIGNIVRVAAAFGVVEIIAVGQRKNVNFFGAHGSQKHIRFQFFTRMADAIRYVREALDSPAICGIEISDDAINVNTIHSDVFHKNISTAVLSEGSAANIHAAERRQTLAAEEERKKKTEQ